MKKSASDGLRGNTGPDPEKKRQPATKSDTAKKVLSAARLISPVDAIASAAESGAHLRRGNVKLAAGAALGVGLALGGGALINKVRKAASNPLKKSGEAMLSRGKEFGSTSAGVNRYINSRNSFGSVSAEAAKKAGASGNQLKSNHARRIQPDASQAKQTEAKGRKFYSGVSPKAEQSKSILERGREFGSAEATDKRTFGTMMNRYESQSNVARTKAHVSKKKMSGDGPLYGARPEVSPVKAGTVPNISEAASRRDLSVAKKAFDSPRTPAGKLKGSKEMAEDSYILRRSARNLVHNRGKK